MKLEFDSWEEFIRELQERKINSVYFHFDELDRYIRFAAIDNNLLIVYVEKDFLLPNDKFIRIKSLKDDFKNLDFKRGLITQ